MRTLGKISFVLAPMLLFASFLSGAMLQKNTATAVCIVLATAFPHSGPAVQSPGGSRSFQHQKEDQP